MTVPDEFPGNELIDGLLPCILIIKSDGLLLPPSSLFTFVVTNESLSGNNREEKCERLEFGPIHYNHPHQRLCRLAIVMIPGAHAHC